MAIHLFVKKRCVKTRIVLGVTLVARGLLATVLGRRSDTRTVTIDVPQMTDATSIRIVTNAALDEVIGKYDGIKKDWRLLGTDPSMDGSKASKLLDFAGSRRFL